MKAWRSLGLLGALATLMACGEPSPRPAARPATPLSDTSVDALPAQAVNFASFEMESVREAAGLFPESEVAERAAPVSLTASDGTGLALTRYDAKAVVDGPLAFTELNLTFVNPENRVREGRFEIVLPEGAAISRLAMKIDGRWQEAEVVERQAARRAYEDFLHRRQDPALLEKDAGNEFRARIFPIPAEGVKEIIVSYSQTLERSDEPYRLPLAGLPEIAHLSATVHADGERKSLALKNEVPADDFVVAAPSGRAGLRGDRFALFRVRPTVDLPAAPLQTTTILFDTSASAALGYPARIARLSKLVGAIASSKPDAEVRVVAFDQGLEPIYAGLASGFGQTAVERLRTRRPLGATDLGAALASVGGSGRLILIGDGIATVQGADESALVAAARAAAERFARLDVILEGGIVDVEAMQRLTRGVFKDDGVVARADEGPDALVARLGRATASGLAVEVDGASWVYPEQLDGVSPGDERIVMAAFPQGHRVGDRLAYAIGGKSGEASLALGERTLVERAAARGEIERRAGELAKLPSDADARRDELRREMVAISTRFRVLSDYTALLVLETDADYDRFGIERTALADIVTVTDDGIDVLARSEPVVAVATVDTGKAGAKNDLKEKKAELLEMSKEVADLDPSSGGALDFEADERALRQEAPEPESVATESLNAGGAPRPLQASPHDPLAAAAQTPMPASPPPPPPPPPPPAPRATTSQLAQGGPPAGADGAPAPARAPAPPSEEMEDSDDRGDQDEPDFSGPPAITGRLAQIEEMLQVGAVDKALVGALRWRGDDPGDVLALVALGNALERSGHLELAARTFGSIIDLYPSRADFLRYAAARLERLPGRSASLAVDVAKMAVAQRPDHLTSHRTLGYALARAGRYEEAFEAFATGLTHTYPSGRFAEGERVLREDLGLVSAAWIQREPKRADEIRGRMAELDATVADKPSLRFVVQWETDANDVDLHVLDHEGGHAFYSSKEMPSGGRLYADVTTGYGPECFAIEGVAKAFPYELKVHYYARGPMGYGMGKIDIVRHDGQGGLTFDSRPYVVMNDDAYLDLGKVERL